jgi:hypothetical protein
MQKDFVTVHRQTEYHSRVIFDCNLILILAAYIRLSIIRELLHRLDIGMPTLRETGLRPRRRAIRVPQARVSKGQ